MLSTVSRSCTRRARTLAGILAGTLACPLTRTLGRLSAIAALSAQNAVYSFSQLHAAGANFGLARPHDAEYAGFGILHNFYFKLFPRRIEVAAGFFYGAVQIFSLEFLKPFHTNPLLCHANPPGRPTSLRL